MFNLTLVNKKELRRLKQLDNTMRVMRLLLIKETKDEKGIFKEILEDKTIKELLIKNEGDSFSIGNVSDYDKTINLAPNASLTISIYI